MRRSTAKMCVAGAAVVEIWRWFNVGIVIVNVEIHIIAQWWCSKA